MPLRSMTGFGRAEGTSTNWRADIECKSVNKDRLDVRVHLADAFRALEPTVRDIVRSYCGRGRIKVHVDIAFDPEDPEEREGDEPGRLLDPATFHALSRELRQLAQRSATGPVSLEDILTFHEYVEREEPVEIDPEDEIFVETVVEATESLVESRTEEGEAIAEALLSHLEELGETIEAYRTHQPRAMEQMRSRIESRVHEALESLEGGPPDDQRLAEEIVYHADRADVSEELQRTESHLASLRELIETSALDDPVGKELDFYLQELVRETNTLASKSRDAELTDLAISAQSTVETMREQAANVE